MALHESIDLRTDATDSPDSGSPSPPRRLGRYLLFERLSRDPLGESHRAGLIGDDDRVERLVTLRLFDGDGIESERFRSAVAGRLAVQQALGGAPPFVETVEVGCEDGVAYVATERQLGRNLAELLTRVRERPSPVPLEHALHVMDRVALALKEASEARYEGERIHHGFLIPAFVQLSSEGEIRLTGFEAAAGLLDLPLDAGARAELAGYLSPEVTAGEPPGPADDVYSMGSIFFELLTGEPLPPLSESGAAQWIEGAVLAAEAAPLPAPIRDLLRETLAPRERRYQTAEAWRQALSRLIAASDQTPTTFNVAFFVHTLFRDELEREAAAVEEERQAIAPPLGPRPLPELGASAATDEAAPIDETAAMDEPEEPIAAVAATASVEHAARRRRWLLPAAGLLLAAAGAGAAYLYFGPGLPLGGDPLTDRRGGAPTPLVTPTTPITTTVLPDPADAPATPENAGGAVEADSGADDDGATEAPLVIPDIAPPPTPEELESQVRQMVEQRAAALEDGLRAEYDERLVELRLQLEEARQAATARVREAEPAVPAADEDAAAPAPSGTGTPTVGTPTEAPAAVPAGATAVAVGGDPATVPPGDGAAAGRAAASGVDGLTTDEPDASEELAATDSEPQTTGAAASDREPVQIGDLVSPGPGVVPPVLERRPNPSYPPAARRLGRRATVRLRVLVDEQGRPAAVDLVSEPSGLGFDRAALAAVRNARWIPATKDGLAVQMWVDLSVDFRP